MEIFLIYILLTYFSHFYHFNQSFCFLLSVVISSGFLFLFLTTSVDAKAVLYIRPVSPKQYSASQPSQYGVGTSYSDFHFTQKDEVLTFEAADAIDSTKYSQPDVANSRNSGVKVPSSIVFKQKHMQTSVQIPSPANFQEQTFSTLHASEKNSLKPLRDTRHLDSAADEGTYSDVPSGDSGHNIGNNLENVLQTHRYDGVTTNLYSQVKNNFTDASDNLVSVSSDAVLSIEVSSNEFNDSSSKNSSVKQSIDIVNDVPSLNYSDFNPSSTLLPISKTVLPEYTTQISVPLNTHVYIDFINQTNVTDSIMSTSIFPSINNDENVTNSLPSTDSEKKLSSGTVAGIVIAVLVSVTLLSSK